MVLDPSLPTVFLRGLRRGVLCLAREREWGLSLGALLGVFFVTQMLVLTLFGVAGMQQLLKARTDIRLEIRSDASRTDTQQFFSAVQALPYVDDAVYITKEQAYAKAQQSDGQLITFLEQFRFGNPFTDTIGITLTSLDDYGTFSQFIGQTQWQRIVDPKFLTSASGQEQHIHELMRIANAGWTLTVLLLILASTTLLLIIIDLVRRSALSRADEVIVERLVGATPFSIILPFLTEATLLLWLSIVVSAGLLVGFLYTLPSLVPDLLNGGSLSMLRESVLPLLAAFFPLAVAAELLLAPVLSTVSAWLGVRASVRSPKMALAR